MGTRRAVSLRPRRRGRPGMVPDVGLMSARSPGCFCGGVWVWVVSVSGMRKPLGACAPRGFLYVWCGGVLLSHTLSGAVPSPCQVLASGFGMGPGVSPGPWPPQILGYRPGNGVSRRRVAVRGPDNGRDSLLLTDRARVRTCSLCAFAGPCRVLRHTPPGRVDVGCLSTISTGRLHPSRGFHVRPINHVFCMGSSAARGRMESLSWRRLPA